MLDLGVWFDEKLSFSEHIRGTCTLYYRNALHDVACGFYQSHAIPDNVPAVGCVM